MTLDKLKLVFLALAGGQVLFCLVTVYLVLFKGFEGAELSANNLYLAPSILLLAGAGTAYAINQMLTQRGQRLPFLHLKYRQYAVTAIIRMAVVEGSNLIILIIALLGGALGPVLFFGLGLLVFLYFKPSREDFVRAYQLTEEEQRQIV